MFLVNVLMRFLKLTIRKEYVISLSSLIIKNASQSWSRIGILPGFHTSGGREKVTFIIEQHTKKPVQTEGEFIPFETTIPEIICKKASSNRVAYVFHSENITFTHEKIKNEVV